MVNDQIFENYNNKLSDLFLSDDDYTFLAGAGVSIDTPSNVPSAFGIIRTMLSFCMPEEVIETILNDLIVEKARGNHQEKERIKK